MGSLRSLSGLRALVAYLKVKDLNLLPIPLLDPVEDGITVWLEAARQHTAPPKHTAHLGVWRLNSTWPIPF